MCAKENFDEELEINIYGEWLPEDYINSLPKDPLFRLLSIIDRIQRFIDEIESVFDEPKQSSDKVVRSLENNLIDAYVVIRVIYSKSIDELTKLGVDKIDFKEIVNLSPTNSFNIFRECINNLRVTLKKAYFELEYKKYKKHYNTSNIEDKLYSLNKDQLTRIKDLLNKLREEVSDSQFLEEGFKNQIIKDIGDIERRLKSKLTRGEYNSILGGIMGIWGICMSYGKEAIKYAPYIYALIKIFYEFQGESLSLPPPDDSLYLPPSVDIQEAVSETIKDDLDKPKT